MIIQGKLRRTARGARYTVLQTLGRKFVHELVGRIGVGRLELVDHTGADQRRIVGGPGGPLVARLDVLDPRFYAAVVFGGRTGTAEAYIEGWWSSEDPAKVVELMTVNERALRSMDGKLVKLLSPANRAAYWLRRNTKKGSRKNIAAHYDLSNDFFASFLDPSMTYSCGIFEREDSTLHEAQLEKIDRACRRLELSPGDRLLEIGTGWGSMAVHAASHYGCRVTTTTVSEAQHSYAAARIAEAGLSDRIELLMTDYRDLEGRYDKLVSIEMIEAVGWKYFDTYFRKCSSLLEDDGRMLLQAIVIRDQDFHKAKKQQDFLKEYIFPGSCLAGVEAVATSVRRSTDMRITHAEDIGPHYATTLRHWRENMWSNIDRIRAEGFNERFIRLWEFYFCYCEGAFRARSCGDVMFVLDKPGCRLAPCATAVRGREDRAGEQVSR